jgi:hypothetical protein
MVMKLTIRHTLIAAVIAAGCSSSSSSSPPVDSAQAPDLKAGPDLASGSDAFDAATAACPNPPNLTTNDGNCNNVPFPTKRVPFTVGTGTAPTFAGGKLVDGLYVAIKSEGWGVTTGTGRQMSIVLLNGGTTLLWSGQTLNADGSGDVDAGTVGLAWLRANYTVSIASQNTLALGENCKAGTASGPPTLFFTATTTDPPQLLLANAQATNPTGSVTTYERQGCPTVP